MKAILLMCESEKCSVGLWVHSFCQTVLAALLFLAGSGFAQIGLDCPEHTRQEVVHLKKGIEAYCTLGDGAHQGPWGGWFPSGQRAISGYYEDGQLHGIETEWFDAAELSGWRRFQSRFKLPRRYRKNWSRGKLHGKLTEWDIRGNILEQSTWHRGEFVSYTRPKGSALEDRQLGRRFAVGPKSSDCAGRELFPSFLQTMMGESAEGYSGYRVLYGTNKDCRREPLPCHNYSYDQLSDILGHDIDGFADSARFAVIACRTGEDRQRLTAEQEFQWRKRSAVYRDPGVVTLLADMHGIWCGRSTRIDGNLEWNREIRIEFIKEDPERAAHVTDTWNRVPGGPMGEPGYVISSLLIPMPRSDVGSAPATQMHFKAISVDNNAGGYALTVDQRGVVFQHTGHTYPMSPDCRGFWMPSGS